MHYAKPWSALTTLCNYAHQTRKMDNLFVFLFIYLVKSNDWIEWSTIRDKAHSMPQKIRVRSSASNTIATKYHVIRMHNAV